MNTSDRSFSGTSKNLPKPTPTFENMTEEQAPTMTLEVRREDLMAVLSCINETHETAFEVKSLSNSKLRITFEY